MSKRNALRILKRKARLAELELANLEVQMGNFVPSLLTESLVTVPGRTEPVKVYRLENV